MVPGLRRRRRARLPLDLSLAEVEDLAEGEFAGMAVGSWKGQTGWSRSPGLGALCEQYDIDIADVLAPGPTESPG